jgi:hypothetical protein
MNTTWDSALKLINAAKIDDGITRHAVYCEKKWMTGKLTVGS